MKSVLIAEDDRDIAMLEADYLRISGYDVTVAHSGSDGLRLALENSFDMLILDVMLPGTDGFEICRAVRREQRIPIMMVTAREEIIDKVRGLGLGADDYLVKPFDPAELVARVSAHLGRFERLTGGDAAPERSLTFGSLRIGLDSHIVTVGDETMRLTNKEFELLCFLASNPNIVFSKDTLFDRIWGLDAIGDTSTVTVHIKHLREKIEEDPSSPRYIQTVWGAGYRFSAR